MKGKSLVRRRGGVGGGGGIVLSLFFCVWLLRDLAGGEFCCAREIFDMWGHVASASK